jgi:hypothetical protein
MPDVSLDVQAALVDLYILLAVWHQEWHKVSPDTPQAIRIAQESRVWARPIAEHVGLAC